MSAAETVGSRTNFSFSLGMPISQARMIATISLDPSVKSSSSDEDKQYPPVLTPRDVVNQLFVRSEEGIMPADEPTQAVKLSGRLATWASEGYFELVPLPGMPESYGNVGYRITDIGAEVAREAIEAAAQTSLRFLASLPPIEG
jgi:hypothetical protein